MWIIPSTASHSVPAVAGSISDSNWLWDALERSVGWSGKPSRSTTWRRLWKRDACLQRLCGRIYEPSTAARGVESWMASLRAIRASRSAKPAAFVDHVILGTYGRTSAESLARWNRPSCFSKTSPITCDRGSPTFSRTFGDWATTLRRACSAREKWVLATSGSGYSRSLWPTLAARDYRTPNTASSQVRRNAGSSRGQQLSNFVVHNFFLPAPTTLRHGNESSKLTGPSDRLNPLFASWLMGWPRIVPAGSDSWEMEWSRFRQRMRSALCGLLSDLTRENHES
jgi:hypothetical protein